MAPVWAKFLAAIALLAGLTLTAVVTVGLWSAELISLAFVPGDLIKAVLTALITQAIARARPESLLSRA